MNREDKKLVVVLGMHRSGTSAITRGLNALGVTLGDRLEPPAIGINDKGYWEDIDIVAQNVEMLKVIGSDWHDLSPIQPSDVELLQSRGYLLRAVELLRRKLVETPYLGFKDPRTAKMLPFWHAVFKHLNLSPYFVIAVRHPLSVAKSLQKRDKFDLEKSYYLWLGHIVPAIVETAGTKRVIVDFDLLMAHPHAQLKRLAKELNLPFDSDSPGIKEYISEFLDANLLHTQFEFEDLNIDPAVPNEVTKAYETLIRVARDEINIDALEVSEIFGQLNSRLWELLPALNYMTRLYKNVLERDEQIISLNQAVIERNGQIAEHNRVAAECKEQLAKVNYFVVERDEQIAKLNRLIAERDGQIAGLSKSIIEIRESTSWRITAPMRIVSSDARRVGKLLFALRWFVQKHGGVRLTLRKAVYIFQREGLSGVKARLRQVVRQSQHKIISPENQAFPESKLQILPYYIDPKLDAKISEVVDVKASVAIHMHLYYTEMLNEFASYLRSVPFQFDLYVSVPKSSDSNAIATKLRDVLSNVGKLIVEQVPNRGRDIAPLIVQFGERLAQYEIIAHIHTKKSPHNTNLSDWCKDILELLIGPVGSNGGRVAHILSMLQTTAKIVFPEGQTQIIKEPTGWADNYGLARRLLEQHTQLSIDDFPVVDFPEGAMFWARTECLKEFLTLPLTYDDFPQEPIPADGTLAHALERLILVFASKFEGQYVRVHKGDHIPDFRYYEEQRDYSSSVTHTDIKVLSYYLPQFHPIPENDLWHGKGFTEWTKVRAANPLFVGHFQQHIPHADIGYYLLDSPDILRKQAEQMRQAGVYGQVFYHYWFGGKLILDEPARLLLNTPDIEMPFCFCWANENWTRRWDGNESEILLGQNYSLDDARSFIQYLIPFFHDSRYIKIDGRPVLFVYRPSSIPDVHAYVRTWGEECKRVGLMAPYIVAVLTRGASDPRDFGMDAGVERVLHDWTAGGVQDIKGSLRPYRPINGSVLSYDDVVDFYTRQSGEKDFTYFRSLVPTWDNTARYGAEAYVLHGSTPSYFQKWMESSIAHAKSTLPEEQRFVLINAWNEWAEGAHLEPDTRFGYSYLNSVGRALSDIPYGVETNFKVVIPKELRVHLSFPEHFCKQLQADPYLQKRFISCLSRSTVFDICSVSVDTLEQCDHLAIMARAQQGDASDADYILQFRRPALFDSVVIEKMIQTACNSPGSVVVSNVYDRHVPLIEVTENGSVASSVGHAAPLLLLPARAPQQGYKNVRMSTNAHSFAIYPNTLKAEKLPAVTTIIRFHKSADLNALKNSLYCLAAMQDCKVLPFIAAQDLDGKQTAALKDVLHDFAYITGVEPLVEYFFSPNGNGDLRSKMLNETLKKVKTRYAAFLDFDDLLMSHAYSWLIGRLKQTGKAASFGRVYSTTYDGVSGVLLKRKRVYEYGYSYEEFLRLNHAPLHSFMLDLDQIDLESIVYFEDQQYMEDYFLTLQLFTQEGSDWESLSANVYIGDYIHSIDRAHTLAISNEQERTAILLSQEYMLCEKRICDLRSAILAA